MLSPAKVEKIRRLLVRGNVSQRHIAKAAGVSRGSVNAIACGKRPDYRVTNFDDEDSGRWLPPVRRGGCGGMVYAPCRLCRIRAALSDQKRRDAGAGQHVSANSLPCRQ